RAAGRLLVGDGDQQPPWHPSSCAPVLGSSPLKIVSSSERVASWPGGTSASRTSCANDCAKLTCSSCALVSANVTGTTCVGSAGALLSCTPPLLFSRGVPTLSTRAPATTTTERFGLE